MNKKNNEIPKTGINYNNFASGIKFNYKNKNRKLRKKEYFHVDEYSCDLEIDDKPELNKKNKNENEFKPGTKQTIDKNEYKRFKKKYNIEEIDEQEEKDEDEIKEDKNIKKNNGTETPPSRIRNNIYTENKNNKNNKIITDSEDEEEEKKRKKEDNLINSFDNNNENEIEEKSDKNNENKDEDKSDKNSDKENKDKSDKNNKNENKISKEIESEKADFEHKIKSKKSKKKIRKWNEQEYQKLKSEAKNYLPLEEYDINKYLLTAAQINNIKQIPELYDKYIEFLSLRKKEDKLVKDVLIINTLKGLKNIYNRKIYNCDFKVNALINYDNIQKFEYKSSEKTAYFDLFIIFISMYVNGFNNQLGEIISIPSHSKLLIPFHSLAYTYSSQAFFCNIAKLIQSFYNKYLAYKVIPIYIKENEEYKYRINSRHIIWKQFESIYLCNKNNKKLYITGDKGEKKLDDKKIAKFSQEVKEGVKTAYEEIEKKIFENHNNLNKFNVQNENITITNPNISAPSSLYNQINEDIQFKIKMNLYKYKMKKLKIQKAIILNDAINKKHEFNNIVKNKIFKQSIYYMNPCDVVQDFLND